MARYDLLRPTKRQIGNLATLALHGSPALALLIALVPALRWLALVTILVLGLAVWWRARAQAKAIYSGAFIVLIAAVGLLHPAVLTNIWLQLAWVVVLGMALVDQPLADKITVHGAVWNISELPRTHQVVRPGPITSVVPVAALALWLVTVFVLPGWVALVVSGACAIWGLWLIRKSMRDARNVEMLREAGEALVKRETAFFVYFSGTPEGGYQVEMWLPILERLQLPYAIIAREAETVAALTKLTNQPVIWANTIRALEAVLDGKRGAVFYVNTERKNADAVRFRNLTHVSLNHGDSDKPPSYSPTLAMFDRIYLAGPAAVRRFADHGVVVDPSKQVVVGRPQVADIEPARDAVGRPCVLYAPTWRGGVKDMNFGSLRYGSGIVAAMLERGCRVIFRPHPYSARDAESVAQISTIDSLLQGADHWDSRSSAAKSIVECFNESDAMITDVSSIASDYLFSGKPFAVVDTGIGGDELRNAFPLVKCAYVIRGGEDPSATLTSLLESDTLASARQAARVDYLGDFPSDEYANRFLTAARADIIGP